MINKGNEMASCRDKLSILLRNWSQVLQPTVVVSPKQVPVNCKAHVSLTRTSEYSVGRQDGGGKWEDEEMKLKGIGKESLMKLVNREHTYSWGRL